MSIRIRITGRGIHGAPTDDNPTGEYPIGHEIETDSEMPPGWAGRAEVVQPEAKSGSKVVTGEKRQG